MIGYCNLRLVDWVQAARASASCKCKCIHWSALLSHRPPSDMIILLQLLL